MILNMFSRKRNTNELSSSIPKNILFPRYRGGEYETLADAGK